jgi:hypothetical protein
MASKKSSLAPTKNVLNTLQAEDPDVISVLASSVHTALYSFDAVKSEWERCKVEGAGFVVRRRSAPTSCFIILNKVSIENYTLDLSHVSKIKLQAPYLMVRYTGEQKKPTILGLWFHEEEERSIIMSAMTTTLQSISSNSAKQSQQQEQQQQQQQKGRNTKDTAKVVEETNHNAVLNEKTSSGVLKQHTARVTDLRLFAPSDLRSVRRR